MDEPNLTPYERALLGIDAFPVGALIRLVIGYGTLAVWQSFPGGAGVADWHVLPWFVAVLLAMRVLPAVLRKVVPVPPGAVAVWVYRRKLAKRFDSYQWRKLFWLGAGMVTYVATSDSPTPWETGLALAALAAGSAAEWVWRRAGAGR